MGGLADYDKEIKQKEDTQKSVFFTIKDTFGLGISEIKKTVFGVVDVPKTGENQISKELEDYEKQVILDRSDDK